MASYTFYPNFPIFLHRYICHICDISQLWLWSDAQVLKQQGRLRTWVCPCTWKNFCWFNCCTFATHMRLFVALVCLFVAFGCLLHLFVEDVLTITACWCHLVGGKYKHELLNWYSSLMLILHLLLMCVFKENLYLQIIKKNICHVYPDATFSLDALSRLKCVTTWEPVVLW